MKFDYVIGNPPYQEETSSVVTTNGQRSRKNIFHHFQIAGDALCKDCCVMIYPGGRWIHQSGKGLAQFGHDQINDKTLSCVYFFPDSKEIFGQAADLADGITVVIKRKRKTTSGFEYIYVKKGHEQRVFVDNPGDELLPLNPNDLTVLKCISDFVTKYHLRYLHDAILPRSLFGIESDFVSKNPDSVRTYSGEPLRKNEIKLLTNDKAGKAGRACWFVADRSVITQNQEYIDQWKVIVSSANAGGQKRDNQIEIVDNYSAFGRARVALRSFMTKREAENFLRYAKSYLVRYAFLMTDEALTTLGRKVPDICNYTDNNGIIDFNADIDKQLFMLSGLHAETISYIKSTVDNIRKKGDTDE